MPLHEKADRAANQDSERHYRSKLRVCQVREHGPTMRGDWDGNKSWRQGGLTGQLNRRMNPVRQKNSEPRCGV
jgi:hypothetical protein